jgi:hypothetical protein
MIGAGDIDIEEEADKVRIIEMSNAVIDPRTMVVYQKSSGSEC